MNDHDGLRTYLDMLDHDSFAEAVSVVFEEIDRRVWATPPPDWDVDDPTLRTVSDVYPLAKISTYTLTDLVCWELAARMTMTLSAMADDCDEPPSGTYSRLLGVLKPLAWFVVDEEDNLAGDTRPVVSESELERWFSTAGISRLRMFRRSTEPNDHVAEASTDYDPAAIRISLAKSGRPSTPGDSPR